MSGVHVLDIKTNQICVNYQLVPYVRN